MNCPSWWKVEPGSPSHWSDSPSEWSLQDYDYNLEASEQVQLNEADSQSIPTRAILAQKLLDDLEQYIKPEQETFSNWLEEKVPIFNDVFETDSSSTVAATGLASLVSTSSNTSQIAFYLKDQDDLTEALGHGHLTPPQSPPAPVLSYLSFPPSYSSLDPTQKIYNHEGFMLETQSAELAHEMAVVEEVVRDVAEQWEELELTDTSSRSSDTTATDDTDDPEWEPSSPAKSKSAARTARHAARPYNTKTPDRRQRKKEQNKNAAIRYRQKKKAEASSVAEEERVHEVKNATLSTKVTDLQREVDYLKGLMREMFRAKGLMP